MSAIQKVKEIQEEFSKKVITKDVLPKNITKICAVDVSYKYELRIMISNYSIIMQKINRYSLFLEYDFYFMKRL